MKKRCLAVCMLSLASVPHSALLGQAKFEFGVDAAYERLTVSNESLESPTLSLLALPMQSVRVGFLLGGGVSVEPRLGITRISGEGESETTQVRASLAGLFFLGGEESSFFLSLVSGLDYANISLGGDGESAVQLRVGGGGGVRMPLRDRLNFRSSVEYHRSFESRDALAVNHLIVAAGFSFLIH